MNSIVSQFGELLTMTHALREQMVSLLTDADLAYRLPGANPTLGKLCREWGEVQHAYTESFKTFKQDFSYRTEEPGVETSVEWLTAWYKTLDAEMAAALEALSEADIQSRVVDRGGWSLPVTANFHTYREAVLIFGGRASVYLKALEKSLPDQWRSWIG
jgi:uncharacterized membrane protein YccC